MPFVHKIGGFDGQTFVLMPILHEKHRSGGIPPSDLSGSAPGIKTKAPQKCGAVTKTQNIDMKAVIMASMTIVVNILAFFNVVASSQISPLFVSGGKDSQNF